MINKLAKTNKSLKDVVSKLETFGYGYQKSYKDRPKGNLKRTVSKPKRKRAKTKSLIRSKDNLGIDYAVVNKKNEKKSTKPSTGVLRGQKRRKRESKMHRSMSKPKQNHLCTNLQAKRLVPHVLKKDIFRNPMLVDD